MLEAAAAQHWNVAADQVKAGVHEVTNTATGEKLGYGDLATAAAALPVPATDTLKLKDPSEFRYIAKGNVTIVDLRGITTGTATYGADVRLPGMKYAVIARPPVVGGKLVSFDPKDALAVPGVEQVVEVKGWAVAVEVPAGRRRRRDCAQHRGGHQGARRAEGGLGRRRQREL